MSSPSSIQPTQPRFVFFLGGKGLEPLKIKEFLVRIGKKRDVDFFHSEKPIEEAFLSIYANELNLLAETEEKLHLVFIFLPVNEACLPSLLKLKEKGIVYTLLDYFVCDASQSAQVIIPHPGQSILETLAKWLGEALDEGGKKVARYLAGGSHALVRAGGAIQEAFDLAKKDLEGMGITIERKFENRKGFLSDPENTTWGKSFFTSGSTAFLPLGGSEMAKASKYLVHWQWLQQPESHLLLYDKNLIYYCGPLWQQLLFRYQEEISKAILSYRGGYHGFLRFSFSKQESAEQRLEELAAFCDPHTHLRKILAEDAPIYSVHLFSFPFKLKGFPIDPAKQGNPKARSIWSDLLDQLAVEWKLEPYQIDRPVYYNEYAYFYDFARDTLFDIDAPGEDIAYRTYRTEDPSLANYVIDLEYQNEPRQFSLRMESLSLQLHKTGVGILTFHLLNEKKEQSSPEAIQLINQFGRRIFPPFYTLPSQPDTLFGNNLDFETALKGDPGSGEIKGVQQLLLAKNIRVFGHVISFGPPRSEGSNLVLPDFFSRILWKEKDPAKAPYQIKPILDDRMFVLCWYGNDVLADHLSRRQGAGRENFLNFSWWYEYIYLDNPGELSCPDKRMQEQLLLESTNTRWSPFGTLYGVTRYSFVVLSSAWPSLRRYRSEYLPAHLRTMYFKMVNLCLMQHASLLAFSELIKEHAGNSPAIKQIFKQYSLFVNRHYFRQVTAQDQGIELYRMLQQQLRIPEEIVELERELKSHHDILVLEESEISNQENERLNKLLALLSTILAIPGLLLGYYSLGLFSGLAPYSKVEAGLVVGCIILAGLAGYQTMQSVILKNPASGGQIRRRWVNSAPLVAGVLLLFLLAFPFFKNEGPNADASQDSLSRPIQGLKNPPADLPAPDSMLSPSSVEEVFPADTDTTKAKPPK